METCVRCICRGNLKRHCRAGYLWISHKELWKPMKFSLYTTLSPEWPCANTDGGTHALRDSVLTEWFLVKAWDVRPSCDYKFRVLILRSFLNRVPFQVHHPRNPLYSTPTKYLFTYCIIAVCCLTRSVANRAFCKISRPKIQYLFIAGSRQNNRDLLEPRVIPAYSREE